MAYCTSGLLSILLIFAAIDFSISWHDPNPDRRYSLSVGRLSGNEPICNRQFYEDSTLLSHNEVFVTFDDCPGVIKGLAVIKPEKEQPERVAIIAGGPGHDYVTLYFRSQKGEAMRSEIKIHAD
ncbi:hypothetical protein QAD02_010730 [Eretmocerus hayati]|uniref:Uncharacterized protein n=1 Tax=Eretmocerus hayati TaxID=131215 RepID=A0ACC2NXC4_9HYME|nr:hypothetical protein QAD02_010730 [Eretmocerus hayati]